MRDFRFILTIFALLFVSFSAGCGYSYSVYNNRAENALRAKDLNKAKELFAYIYQEEKKSDKDTSRNLIWAFYRLGVVHELMGKNRLAKGYYWGDSVEEGFYAKDAKIEWFAKTGWQWLDQDNPSRTLDQILKLELTIRTPEKKVVRRKKQIRKRPRQKTRDSGLPANLPTNQPVRVFNRSLTPPAPGTPEPFRVYY